MRLTTSCLVFFSGDVTDSKPQPLQLGRADALNARSQQILEVVGILDELLSQGLKCNSEWPGAGAEQRDKLTGYGKRAPYLPMESSRHAEATGGSSCRTCTTRTS